MNLENHSTPQAMTAEDPILLIEDDPIYRHAVRRMLAPLHVEVIEAINGNEAIRIAQTQAVSIAICDMFMPEKDGIETIRELRHLLPAVHIIAMSGSDQSGRLDVLDMATLLGASAVLRKPFGADTLVQAVARARLLVSTQKLPAALGHAQ